MSEAFVNQVTLDCLLNKQMYNNQIRTKKTTHLNKEERKFYRKRTFNLFKEIMNGNTPENLLPDVKYAYDNFFNSTIQYFKTIDNNDIIQAEYKDVVFLTSNFSDIYTDCSINFITNSDADLLLTRSIKLDGPPTLDKYVKKTFNKKKEQIVLPKQREINLNDPELKTKGIKKDNINNIYED